MIIAITGVVSIWGKEFENTKNVIVEKTIKSKDASDEIKVKIKREQNVTSETTYLILSKNRLCLYEKEKLIN